MWWQPPTLPSQSSTRAGQIDTTRPSHGTQIGWHRYAFACFGVNQGVKWPSSFGVLRGKNATHFPMSDVWASCYPSLFQKKFGDLLLGIVCAARLVYHQRTGDTSNLTMTQAPADCRLQTPLIPWVFVVEQCLTPRHCKTKTSSLPPPDLGIEKAKELLN